MSRPNPVVRVPTVPLGLTMFAMMPVVGVIFGSIIGYFAGNYYFSVVAGIGGALLLGALGFVIGCLPKFLTDEWTFRKMQRSSNEELRAIANSSPWTFNQTLALLNLQLRGEDLQTYLPRIVALLESNDLRARYFGRDALTLVFTPLAKKMGFYSPGAPEEERRRKVAVLRELMPLKNG